MKILITGGLGYIGSHTAIQLLECGHEILIIDNLSNSRMDVLTAINTMTTKQPHFINLDIRNTVKLKDAFDQFQPDSVIHFAACKDINESIENPMKYFDVNIGGLISLLIAMDEVGCKNIIFSSSAAVYGIPAKIPIDERHPTMPLTPYGRSKLIGEDILKDWSNPDRKVICLRYFNPVGAHSSGIIGEIISDNPSNLMPMIALVAAQKREQINIYGVDYPTKDGSGVRDFIHVDDVAHAHICAIRALERIKQFEIVNIGTGSGYSVKELISVFQKSTNTEVKYTFSARRPGDVAECWAAVDKSKNLLQWRAKRSLSEMCEDTWRWFHKYSEQNEVS